MKRFALLCLSLMLLATDTFAQDVSPGKEEVLAPKQNYSPYVDQHFPNMVFWGDAHLHTFYSNDAGMIGTTVRP